MSVIHVTQHFSTHSPDIMDECDELMGELLRREATAPNVRDAAVSADGSLGLIEVEVVADGDGETDAIQAALSRIRAAVSAVVALDGTTTNPRDRALTERERSVELLPA